MNVVNILLVGAGGCLGSMARYLAVASIGKKFSTAFPFGTLTVNLLGSLLLGCIMAILLKKTGTHHEEWKLFLATGFCGGFTTFSAFAAENVNLFETRFPGSAMAYIIISVVGGLLAVWIGFAMTKNIV